MDGSVWAALLGGAGAAFVLMAWLSGGRSFEWGATDAEGLAVGLHVEERTVAPGSSITWRAALKNGSSRERQIIVANDLDPRPRCRLLAEPLDGRAAQEFEPAARGPATSANISRTVTIPAGKSAELDLEAAPLGSRMGPGRYRLKVVYGGEGFTVRLESGSIEVAVK